MYKTIKERCTQGRKATSLLYLVLWDQGISKEQQKENIQGVSRNFPALTNFKYNQ
jgi:hypothetical protein